MTLDFLQAPNLKDIPKLKHGFTTRMGGVSADSFSSLNLGWATGDDDDLVSENYDRLAQFLGATQEQIVGVRQTHSSTVVKVNQRDDREVISNQSADVLITDQPALFLSVRVADCLPILLVDPHHHAAAAVHAGWRGTLAKVLPQAIAAMTREFSTQPSELLVAIGPGIGICCFEVAAGVASLFVQNLDLSEAEIREKDASAFLDLSAINARLATREGVRTDRIWKASLCTRCDAKRFYSYRRDGKRSGRQIGVIGWQP